MNLGSLLHVQSKHNNFDMFTVNPMYYMKTNELLMLLIILADIALLKLKQTNFIKFHSLMNEFELELWFHSHKVNQPRKESQGTEKYNRW